MRANVAYDRLQTYLDDLAAVGLIDGSDIPRLTARGDSFLRAYREWIRVLAQLEAVRPAVTARGPDVT